MFLLDTHVVSELRRADRADANVRAWAGAQPPAWLYVSAISLLELEQGALRICRRDPTQGERLLAWYEGQVLPAFEGRTLAVDRAVARRAAPLHVPDPLPDMDALIAATALVHGMTLVTRNVRDFERTGVHLLNPWQSPSGG